MWSVLRASVTPSFKRGVVQALGTHQQLIKAQSTSANVVAIGLKEKPHELRKLWPGATFNISKMTELLDHDNHQMRKQLREFVSDPVMTPKYNIPLAEVQYSHLNVIL